MNTTFFKLVILVPWIFGASVYTGAGALRVPADYATIQEAVNAAQDEEVIEIASGNYYEQVLITNKTALTLRGEPGTVLHATNGMAQTLPTWTPATPIVGVLQSDVVLSGLTIHGEHLGPFFASRPLNGIFFVASHALVTNCTIKSFRGPTLQTQTYARGLTCWNGLSLETDPVRVEIFNCAFEDNESSLVLAGDDRFHPTLTRTIFRIEGNTIAGPGLSAVAAGGINIFPGAKGEIIGNIITGYTSTINPATNVAWGVGIHDGYAFGPGGRKAVPIPDITFENNTFASNNIHLFLMLANNSRIQNNIFRRHGPVTRLGGVALSGTNITMANNDFSDLPTGILLMGGETLLNVHLGNAVGTRLQANWFSNVPGRVQIQPGATNVYQQGTQIPPFAPGFQSIARTGTNPSQSLTLTVRSWHGTPTTLESSTNLQNWAPVVTNTPPLPSFELADPISTDTAHRFYRLRSGM